MKNSMKNILWPNSRNGLLRNIFILICVHLILWEGDYENILGLIFTSLFLTIGQRLLLIGIKGQGSFLDSFLSIIYLICIALLIIDIIIFIGDTFFIEEKPPLTGPQRRY